MPLTQTYSDAYLTPLITEARETDATAFVDELGALPDYWVARLIVLRAYIVTCQESMKAPEDLFTAKLAAYRKEWDSTLAQARAAQSAINAAAGGSAGGSSFMSIELVRS